MQFYVISCMESYDSIKYIHAVSMNGTARNHMAPWAEPLEKAHTLAQNKCYHVTSQGNQKPV